jgi:hypothetical protein
VHLGCPSPQSPPWLSTVDSMHHGTTESIPFSTCFCCSVARWLSLAVVVTNWFLRISRSGNSSPPSNGQSHDRVFANEIGGSGSFLRPSARIGVAPRYSLSLTPSSGRKVKLHFVQRRVAMMNIVVDGTVRSADSLNRRGRTNGGGRKDDNYRRSTPFNHAPSPHTTPPRTDPRPSPSDIAASAAPSTPGAARTGRADRPTKP